MNEEYNWKNYKVELKGNFTTDTLNVRVTDELPKTNEYIDKVVRFAWLDLVKYKKSVNLPVWESVVYSLRSFNHSSDVLDITLGKTSYKHLQGTNATNWILGDIFGEDYLANGLLVQSIVITSDNYFVLGKRNSGAKEGLEQQAIFGGTADEDELAINNSSDFFQTIKNELAGELGVDDSMISDLTLNYLFKDWKHYPVFLFVTVLNVTKGQLTKLFAEKGDKDEHVGLEHYSHDDLQNRLRNEQERFSDLTLASFDIYFKEA